MIKIPTISNPSIISDAIIRIRSLLSSGLSDPGSPRAGTEQFILTSWPERSVKYPIITLDATMGVMERLGMQSEGAVVPVNFVINVFSKNVKQRDQLAGSVFNLLRTSQYDIDGTTGSGTVLERLYDFRLANITSLDETGKEGLHRKIIDCQYKFITI
ncbi:MAG: hypothetical protein AABY22_36950 [Nanoarchaeota archaeon]